MCVSIQGAAFVPESCNANLAHTHGPKAKLQQLRSRVATIKNENAWLNRKQYVARMQANLLRGCMQALADGKGLDTSWVSAFGSRYGNV